MSKIVRSDHTVIIASIDVKLKRSTAKIVPKIELSQLGNTEHRSRFVESFQKSHDEGQDFVNAVRYASNAPHVMKGRSSCLWYDNLELESARMQVQSCNDKYGVSSWLYANAITKNGSVACLNCCDGCLWDHR